MMRLLLLLTLVACSRAPVAAETAPPAPAPAPVPAVTTPAPTAPIRVGGRMYALVRVTQTLSECSNAGGVHYILTVASGAAADPRRVHFGGHASYEVLFGGDRFVAEIHASPRAGEDRDGNPDSSAAGWCLGAMPATDGVVLRLTEVADDAEGAALLATIATSGWPTSAVDTREAGRRAIGVARSVRRRGRVVLVSRRPPHLSVGFFSVELPAGVELPAPAGTAQGKSFVVIARASAQGTDPAWRATRVIPAPADQVDDVARFAAMGLDL